MKRKFSTAVSLAMISAIIFTSLALADVLPAHIVFITDIVCPVTVRVTSYTDPITGPNQTASGSTRWTLDTVPDTSVTFFYPASVVCNGVSYNFQSAFPASPIPNNVTPPDSTTTVTGHYVSDITPPVWTVPADFSVEATGPAGAVVTYVATATDPDDAVNMQSCTPASGATFPLGTTTVNCTATDTHGNTGTASFHVTVRDTTPPVVTVPADIFAQTTDPAGALVNFSATANDLVDGAVTPICVPASGSAFPLGTTLVTCSAADAHGNTGAASFNVTVTLADITPPVWAVPADFSVEATEPAGAVVTYVATATDPDDAVNTQSCTPSSGSTFPLGTTTVNCTATDTHGNTGTASFHVTVSDTTPPAITVPGDSTVEATDPAGAVVNFSASADDVVDGAITPTCIPASGSVFSIGTTSVTCTATDAHGNTGTASFKVTVNEMTDTTPPVWILPDSFSVEATGPAGAIVTYTASVSDPDDAINSQGCLPVSGSMFALGTTTVNCSATDTHGNTSSGGFDITVVDTTPPALTLPANMTVTALNASGAPVSFNVSANDMVDGPVAINCSAASGSMFPVGMTTVNCGASDLRGNTARGSFTVAVQYAAAGVQCNGIPGHQILQPINTDGSSVFKQGSTVPAKFRVCGADGNSIGTPGVVTSFRLMNSDEEVLSTTSDTAFRSGNQQWIFNISTKNLTAGNTYVYLITLNDGSTIQFQFTLK